MLALPNEGLNRSVHSHNVDLDIVCDWIEASAVFGESQMSKSDVVEVLLENEIYAKSDFAFEIVDQAWGVVLGRTKYLNGPLGILGAGNRITRRDDWTHSPAYSFCLVLACAALYPAWARSCWEGGASDPRALFEELAQESFSSALSGWTFRRIGWSPDHPVKLRECMNSIIDDLNEVAGAELDLHVDSKANELGLDLLGYCSFSDSHASLPVLLIQCASGRNWKSKRQTPDIEVWRSMVSFNSNPVRGFAIPFAFAEANDFRKHSKSVNGVFIDRCRLLGAFPRKSTSVSPDLDRRLSSWVNTCLSTIPRNS
jgi:hypothetical protein